MNCNEVYTVWEDCHGQIAIATSYDQAIDLLVEYYPNTREEIKEQIETGFFYIDKIPLNKIYYQ